MPEPWLWLGHTTNTDMAVRTLIWWPYVLKFDCVSNLNDPSTVGLIKPVLRTLNYSVNTYIHNEEVEPTPGIGEVLDKAVCDPLQQHLQDENIGEDLVCILQHCFDVLPLLDVNVLKCLRRIDAIKLCHFDPRSELRLFICKAHSGVVYSLTCRWQTATPSVVIHS